MPEIKIIESEDSKEFVSKVNKALSEGWQLHGDAQSNCIVNTLPWNGGQKSYKSYYHVQHLKK